jgi:hypothetical protein
MSNDVRAFQPGPTVTQNLAVTAGAASITLNNTAGTRQARVVVAGGTTNVWVAFDTTATTTQGMILLGNTVESFTLPQGCATMSFISTATGMTAYVTVGVGT